MKLPNDVERDQRRNQDLQRFLGADDADFEKTCEEIHRKLIHFFVYRGCSDYEDLAQKTFAEVLKDCGTVADSYVGDPLLWFYGVARNVLRTASRRRPDPLLMPKPDPPEEKEDRDECLRRCMGAKLNEGERSLITLYYQGERAAKIALRKQLAAILGKTDNGLRLKVHRIRNRLRGCVTRCLSDKGLLGNESTELS